MSSILTNTAAMTALKSLQITNKSIETTQARISTGKQVAEASDNAAYWSIATTMRSDSSALSTVQDALGLGAAKVDVAYTGINSALEVVDEIKSKLVAASEPGVDRSKIQSEISELQTSLQAFLNPQPSPVKTGFQLIQVLQAIQRPKALLHLLTVQLMARYHSQRLILIQRQRFCSMRVQAQQKLVCLIKNSQLQTVLRHQLT